MVVKIAYDNGHMMNFETFDEFRNYQLIDVHWVIKVCLIELEVVDLEWVFDTFRNLSELDILYTPITEIPENIGNCCYLKYITLSVVEITTLPKTIKLLPLKDLVITHCPLTHLPNELYTTPLQNLTIAHTQLSSISAWIGYMSTLRSVTLKNNKISINDTRIIKKILKDKLHI